MKSKVLLFSTGDVHGAYEAVYRIASFLFNEGYEVCMMVKTRTKSDNFIRQISDPPKGLKTQILERLGISKERENRTIDPKYLFLDEDESFEYTATQRLYEQLPFIPDLIVSGMTHGFINTQNLADLAELTKAKIFFLTVDMIPLTGGCHYSWGCKGYEEYCSNCPAVHNERDREWVKTNFLIKKKNVNSSGMGVIAGSGLTLEQANKSTLFKNQEPILNINSCIDTLVFNSKKRAIAKEVFDIPSGAKVIFSGSLGINDPRKGFAYLKEALMTLADILPKQETEKIYFVLAGNDIGAAELESIPFKKIGLDYIKDYRLLSLLYQSADVFVCSSIEDSGPMMVSEALACGTPVAGFDTGILTNMVIDGYNGFKTELKNTRGLADCILKILNLSTLEFQNYSNNAVRQVEEHSSQNQVLKVFQKLMSN
jgi:glycosyltransferase involved in cell wall biosynthesis